MKKNFFLFLILIACGSLEAKIHIDAAFLFDFIKPPSNVRYVRERIRPDEFYFNQPFFIDSAQYNSMEMEEILLRYPNGQAIILDSDYHSREIDRLVNIFHDRLTIYADRTPDVLVIAWLRAGATVQVNALGYSSIERRRLGKMGVRLIFPTREGNVNEASRLYRAYPNRVFIPGGKPPVRHQRAVIKEERIRHEKQT